MKSIFARLFAFVLAVSLSVALTSSALAAETGFSDVPATHWAADAIAQCAAQGTVTGYDDGTFRPDEPVTYAQLIVMLTRTFYPTDVASVTNAAETPWYYANAQVIRNKSLDAGTKITDRHIWPVIACAEKPINRYEMAQMIANMLQKDGQLSTPDAPHAVAENVSDWNDVPESYQTGVAICCAQGIITGMSDGTFSGTANMTRAQACVIITRLMGLMDSGTFAPTATVGKLANGKDITVENVSDILDQLEREYPTGTIWGSRDTLNNNTYSAGEESVDVLAITNQWYSNYGREHGRQTHTSTEAGCGGFAAMVSDAIFGQSCAPCREVTNIDDVRPGDLIIKFTEDGHLTHVSIVRHVTKDSQGRTVFNSCDGNMSPDSDGNNGIVKWPTDASKRQISRDDFGSIYRVWTRYPD